MNTKNVIVGNYYGLRDMSGEPFQLNVGKHSHFIVKYQQQLLDDIINNANEELDAILKSQLLQNLLLLSERHQISYHNSQLS